LIRCNFTNHRSISATWFSLIAWCANCYAHVRTFLQVTTKSRLKRSRRNSCSQSTGRIMSTIFHGSSRLSMRWISRVVLVSMMCALIFPANAYAAKQFEVVEATIDGIQKAILAKRLTVTGLVQMYLDRIKAYNGPCVNEPQGILGPISIISRAKTIPSFTTVTLRPATLKAMGFNSKLARSQTDMVDNSPDMPDALEVAAAEDEYFAQTGKLVGPLHGVVMGIKDAYDTFDMRTTS